MADKYNIPRNNLAPVNTKTKDDLNAKLIQLAVPDDSIVEEKRKFRIKLRDSLLQKSTPGLFVNAFTIQQSDWDDKNTFYELMADYTSMRNGDAMVSSSVDVMINPLLNSKIKVNAGQADEDTPPSAKAIEAQQYIQYCFDQMYNPMVDYHRHLCLAIYYGCAFFEEIWVRGDDYNGHITNRLGKLSPIQTDTINRFYYDDMMEFMGVSLWRRQPNMGSRRVDLLDYQMHCFSPLGEFGNVQGRSIIRPVRTVWMIKKRLLKAAARAAERGAGLPVVTLDKSIKDSDGIMGQKAQTIVQTIGNSENAGVVDQEGVYKFRLEGLQNQNDVMPLLNFCNSEIVYNSLTQFMISGIGRNGSRAATSEHKAPFVEALNGWTKIFEDDYSKLSDKMIDNSYLYGSLERVEYPNITLEHGTELDLSSTAANFMALVQSTGIKPTPQDEAFLRSVFDLPTIPIDDLVKSRQTQSPTQISQPIQQNGQNNNTNNQNNQQNDTNKNLPNVDIQPDNDKAIIAAKLILAKRGKTKYEGRKHPGVNYINDNEGKIKDIIDTHHRMMLDNVKIQLHKDKTKPVTVSKGLRDALYKSLNDHYNKAHSAGYEYASSVLKDIDGKIKLSKATGPLRLSSNSKKLQYIVDLLGDNIETNVNTGMLNTNDKTIDKAGGLSDYIDKTYEDNANGIKGSLLNNTLIGYIDGSNSSQDDYESRSGNQLLKAYTVQLERQNVCDQCFPYEGLVLSRAEAEDMGLNWNNTPTNPACLGLLGKNQCRCCLIPEDIDNGGDNESTDPN